MKLNEALTVAAKNALRIPRIPSTLSVDIVEGGVEFFTDNGFFRLNCEHSLTPSAITPQTAKALASNPNAPIETSEPGIMVPTEPSDSIGEFSTDIFRSVVWAAGTSPSRFNLEYLYYDAYEKCIVGTNGHNLAKHKWSFEVDSNLLIPADELRIILSMKKALKADNRLFCRLSRNYLQIFNGEFRAWLKLGSGSYPNYKHVLPTSTPKATLTINDTKQLTDCCKQAIATHKAIGDKKKLPVIGFDINGSARLIHNQNIDETFFTSWDIYGGYTGKAKVYCQARYVQDHLSAFPKRPVHLEFRQKSDPIVVSIPDCPEYQALLMPVRL